LDEITWLVPEISKGKRVKVNSSSNADHFQIFSEDRGAAQGGPIVRSPKRLKFLAKTLTAGGIKINIGSDSSSPWLENSNALFGR
jgi:hypothetical protein